MEVQLTPDQRALVRQAIATGRLQHEQQAVQQALELWEERERRRMEILASVQNAEASLARGTGRSFTTREQVTQFADDVKRRALARLTSEDAGR